MQRIKVKDDIIIDSSTIKEMEDEVFTNLKALKYLRSLGLNDELIKDNITRIYDFALDMKNCKNCKGLSSCNKNPKYIVSSVSYKNGVVDRNLVPCKKYLEFTNFKKRLVVADFEEGWFENQIWKDVSNIKSFSKMSVLNKYKDVIKNEGKQWIFMKGNISSGKSFFAATLCVDAARNGAFERIGFINVPERFKELADLAFSKNPKFDEEMNRYKTCDLLVLDDFGNEFKSDFVRDNILFPILSYRAKQKLFTIFTSNYSIEECASMYQTTNASKPKVEQIRNILKMLAVKEITLLDSSDL